MMVVTIMAIRMAPLTFKTYRIDGQDKANQKYPKSGLIQGSEGRNAGSQS